MLLVTRPLPSAAETARRLRAAGHACAIAPMLHTEPVRPRAVDTQGVQAVIVTSGNAARALKNWPALQPLPALAVGDKTQKLLRASGFKHVVSAGGDKRDVLALAQKRLFKKRGVLLLVGASTTGRGLAALLKRAGFTVRRLSVYRVTPVTTLPPAALKLLRAKGARHGVLFYSARTARAFVDSLEKSGLKQKTRHLAAYCLSAAVARAAQKTQWRAILAASRPTEPDMMALLPRIGASGKTKAK